MNINKHGCFVALSISKKELDKLKSIENKFWIQQAEKVEKEGDFIGVEGSENLIKHILDA